MTSLSAKTEQNPSASDTIMASALIEFSRNNVGASQGTKSSEAEPLVNTCINPASLPTDSDAKTNRSK